VQEQDTDETEATADDTTEPGEDTGTEPRATAAGGGNEPDTEERERRRRSVESVDPPTEDTKLTELL
jgi:hypothetical protein